MKYNRKNDYLQFFIFQNLLMIVEVIDNELINLFLDII